VIVLFASLTIVPVATRIGELSDQIEGERLLLGRFVAMAALQDKLADMQNAGPCCQRERRLSEGRERCHQGRQPADLHVGPGGRHWRSAEQHPTAAAARSRRAARGGNPRSVQPPT
jgi:hypothetical protein